MNSQQTVISESELLNIVEHRAIWGNALGEEWVRDRIINYSIKFIANRNPGVNFKKIYFSNCVFNISIGIWEDDSIGQIYFYDCEFNEDVQAPAIVKFDHNCRFKKNLTIRCIRNESISDLTVDGNLSVTGSCSAVSNINSENKSIENQVINIDSINPFLFAV